MFNDMTHKTGLWTRRELLQAAGTLSVAATLGNVAAADPDVSADSKRSEHANESVRKESPIIRIGIFLATFSGKTVEAKLDSVKAAGLDCVQFGMDCVGLPPMPDEIPPELLARIRREAAAREIEIASVQGTFNMCHPDADYRAAGVRRMKVLADEDIVMAHAKDVSHDGDAGHEAAGHGKLDYDRYVSLLHASGFTGPLFLHGLREAQVPGCVTFLREKLNKLEATNLSHFLPPVCSRRPRSCGSARPTS